MLFKPSGISNRYVITAKLTDASAARCYRTICTQDTPQHDPQLTLAAAAQHTQSTLTDARGAAQHRARSMKRRCASPAMAPRSMPTSTNIFLSKKTDLFGVKIPCIPIPPVQTHKRHSSQELSSYSIVLYQHPQGTESRPPKCAR